MTQELYTVQHNNKRLAHMEDITVYDVTVMSGDPIFAPTWDMVRMYKSGKLSEEAYEKEYREMMFNNMRRFPKRWDRLMEYDRLALACYCKSGHFCHRHILKQLLLERAWGDGDEIVDGGELA